MLRSPVFVFSQTRSLTIGVGLGAGVGARANRVGSSSAVMKLALIAVPVVALYSPTVLLPVFATKRVVPSPDNASPMGPLSPRYELRTITPHNLESSRSPLPRV